VTGSLPQRSRRPVTALFVLSVVALLATAALTVVAVSAGATPERTGMPAANGDRPSPTSQPPASRAEGPSHCLIGSWQVTSEVAVFPFYSDTSPQPFTMSGTRTYEFRPNGTVINRGTYTLSATHQGNAIRVEVTGTRVLSWSLSGETITYSKLTSTNQVFRYYDQRGLIETQTEKPNPNHGEVDTIRCAGARVEESNAEGYRSTWARTASYGVYG
jgi:hypothetical protein